MADVWQMFVNYNKATTTPPEMMVTLWILWWTNIAIENGHFTVDFPIKNGDFP